MLPGTHSLIPELTVVRPGYRRKFGTFLFLFQVDDQFSNVSFAQFLHNDDIFTSPDSNWISIARKFCGWR